MRGVRCQVEASAPGNVEVRALKSDRGAFVWLNNKNGTAQTNFQVKVNGAANSTYEWRTFDNWKGGFGGAANVTASGGTMTVTVPVLAANTDMALWFSDKTAVPVAARNALPAGFKVAFDPATNRVTVSAEYRTLEGVRYRLMDAAGRELASGTLDLASATSASRVLDLPSHRAGLHYLKVSVGERAVTRAIPLGAR